MTVQLHVQLPERDDTAIGNLLATYASTTQWDELRVAVAYASVAGLLHLLDALNAPARPAFTSKWLIGLDDCLTQPGVLRSCGALENSEVRTAILQHTGRRFHPKVLIVGQRRVSSFACVGSSNLTIGGLRKNCEAVATVRTDANDRAGHHEQLWNDIWNVGQPITSHVLDAYEAEYNERRPPPTGVPETPFTGEDVLETASPSPIITDDLGSLDPSLASTCWIEVGNNTAKGYELEFKSEQALFFDLSPSGNAGVKQYRQFIASNGSLVMLPLRYQPNGMWRLQMKSEIPEVAAGLRPRDPVSGRLGRSPYVAVFSRTDNRNSFFIRFISLDSEEFHTLRQQSQRSGASGRTSARRYGWC